MKKNLFILFLLASFFLFPWFIKTEEVTAKKVDGINKYHFITLTQTVDEKPPSEGDEDESSDKGDDDSSSGESEPDGEEPIPPENTEDNNDKGNPPKHEEPNTKPGNYDSENKDKKDDKKTSTKSTNNIPRQQTNVQRPSVQPWQRQIPMQTEITEGQSYTTVEVEDEGIDIDEEKDETIEESEDKDGALTIEQLKQMDIIIRNEDGKYYVIYKDENNNIIKQEITKYEAMQLGYEDDVVPTDEAMVDHTTLTTNNDNGTLKKIFGVVAVTLTSLGLIAGTYIYYRRKIA